MLFISKLHRISASEFREAVKKFPIRNGGHVEPKTNVVIAGQGVMGFLAKHEKLSNFAKDDSLIKEGGTVYSDEGRVSILPVSTDVVSRHNSACRPDLLAKSLLTVPGKQDMNVTICVNTKQDLLPSALAAYRSFPFVHYKSQTDSKEMNLRFYVGDGSPIEDIYLEEFQVIGESVRIAQGLTDLPPNELNPATFTDIVLDLVKDINGVTVDVVTDLESRGLLGIHTVGKASATAPRMIVLSHTVGTGGDVIAIVGKGITYDTGGLSLKPSNSMKGMKRDMGGAAAAFGAFLALAKLFRTSPSTIHCVLCLAENSLGSRSYRNDDIVRLYSGKTVEINNTDAEGRLLLADGVVYAAKDLKANVIVDIATLTGAAAVASGKLHASIMSTDEGLVTELVEAGKKSGDLVHELVFCPELHRVSLKSTMADMISRRVNIRENGRMLIWLPLLIT